MPLSVHALQKQCLEAIPVFRFCLVLGSVAVWTCSFMKDKHIVPLVHPCIHLGANEMAPGKKQQPSGRRGSCAQPWRWNIWAPISWLCLVARKRQLPRRAWDHGKRRQKVHILSKDLLSYQRISHPCCFFSYWMVGKTTFRVMRERHKPTQYPFEPPTTGFNIPAL